MVLLKVLKTGQEACRKRLLVTLRSPADSGGVNFLLLLKNADNASGNEFLQSDGVLILDN